MKTIKEISRKAEELYEKDLHSQRELIPGEEGLELPEFCFLAKEVVNLNHAYIGYYACCNSEKEYMSWQGVMSSNKCPFCRSEVVKIVKSCGMFESKFGRVLYFSEDTIIFKIIYVKYIFDDNEYDEKASNPEEISKMSCKYEEASAPSSYIFFNKKFGLKRFSDNSNFLSTDSISELPFEKFLLDETENKFFSLSEFCGEKISHPELVTEWNRLFKKLSQAIFEQSEKKSAAAALKREANNKLIQDMVEQIALSDADLCIETDIVPPEGTVWRQGYGYGLKSFCTCSCGYVGEVPQNNNICPSCGNHLKTDIDPASYSTYVKAYLADDGNFVLARFIGDPEYNKNRRVVKARLKHIGYISLKKTKAYIALYRDNEINSVCPNRSLNDLIPRIQHEDNYCLNEETVMDILRSSVLNKTGFVEFVDSLTSINEDDIEKTSIGTALCDVVEYMKIYRAAPIIEQFAKSGMFRALNDIARYPETVQDFPDPTASSLRKVLGLTKGQFRMARENNFSLSNINTLKSLMSSDISACQEDLIWAVPAPFGQQIALILKEESRLKLSKIKEYLISSCYEEQCIDIAQAASLWLDYIRLGKMTGAEYRLFPSSLKKEHDVFVFAFANVVDKTKAKIFDENTDICKKFEYSFENFMIKAPYSAEDIIKEGISLNHSVAQHIGFVADKLEYILFIRQKEDPEKSFYTVELTTDRKIVQVRGMSNRPVNDDKLFAFLHKWAKAKKLEITSL